MRLTASARSLLFLQDANAKECRAWRLHLPSVAGEALKCLHLTPACAALPMTKYLLARPPELPALPPELASGSWQQEGNEHVRADVLRRIEVWLEIWAEAAATSAAAGTPGQRAASEDAPQDAECATLAYGRPGRDPSELMSDLAYARWVLEQIRAQPHAQSRPRLPSPSPVFSVPAQPPLPAQPGLFDVPGTGPGSPAAATDPGGESTGAGFVAGRLRVGAGRAAMNTQVLRSAAFASPLPGVPLPVVADKADYQIVVRGGVRPTADHLDMLLFAVSRVAQQPAAGSTAGTEVSFTLHQFIAALGWACNTAGYDRARRVIAELRQIDMVYLEGEERTTFALFGDVTEPANKQTDRLWRVRLSGSLFRLFELGRNTLIDLQARAALRMEFGRWLHGFLSTQTAGQARSFDALELCEAGGLCAARDTDSLKHLRATLALLAKGEVSRASKITAFRPLIAPEWRVEKDSRTKRWVLHVTRI